jgi:hypothetical protein
MPAAFSRPPPASSSASETLNAIVALVKLAAQRCAWTPEADHRFSIRASPQKNDIACKIVMRELQSDDLNVESLRRFGIRDRQMRFVQVHVSRLHALY